MSTPICKATPPADDCQCCGNPPRECLCGSVYDDAETDVCGMCGGDGVIDAHEDDPSWYEPGETKPCPQCGGAGA